MLARESCKMSELLLPAICSSVFARDASSPTFRQVFERSICRISPHKTFPGPISTKVCTPSAISRRMLCSHFTAPVTCATSVARARNSSLTKDASTLHTTGYTGFCIFRCVQVRFQTVLRGLHQRTMEGRAHGQQLSRALRPRSSASFAPRSTAAVLPEITICSGELIFAGEQTSPCAASWQTAATFSNSMPRIAAIAPTPTGTASCIYFPRLRTVRTASAKAHRPGGDVCRILAQAVAGHKTRLGDAALKNSQRRNRHGENRRLRDLGQPQLFFRTFKAHLRQFVAQRLVGFFKRLPRDGIFLGRDLCPCPRPAIPGRGK